MVSSASRRSSDSESMTIRDGFFSSKSRIRRWIVSESSTSLGWNIVYCSSGRRLASAGTNSAMGSSSGVQPCERADASSSLRGSESVT